MRPNNNLLGSFALLLISSAGAAGGVTGTLLPNDVDTQKEQISPSSSSQLHDHHQQHHVPQQAKHSRRLRSRRRSSSGIGNGEAPAQPAQGGDDLHGNSAAALLLKRPSRRGDRSLYEYDGKLKLKWGKDGQHAPGNLIDIVEKKHRDVPSTRNKTPSPGVDHDQEDASTANTSTAVDPILYYCTHVYACESLTAQIPTLTNGMESLPSYEAMIVQCEGVTSTSSPCNMNLFLFSYRAHSTMVSPS